MADRKVKSLTLDEVATACLKAGKRTVLAAEGKLNFHWAARGVSVAATWMKWIAANLTNKDSGANDGELNGLYQPVAWRRSQADPRPGARLKVMTSCFRCTPSGA